MWLRSPPPSGGLGDASLCGAVEAIDEPKGLSVTQPLAAAVRGQPVFWLSNATTEHFLWATPGCLSTYSNVTETQIVDFCVSARLIFSLFLQPELIHKERKDAIVWFHFSKSVWLLTNAHPDGELRRKQQLLCACEVGSQGAERSRCLCR